MPDAHPQVVVLGHFIDEVRALFHTLKAAAEHVHGEGERSAARRGLLLGLAKTGPQTVPQIARSRPVSRQHIQVLVNGLLKDGLVELAPNPAHKRSKLVQLTATGHARARELHGLEAEVFSNLEYLPPNTDLARAAETLASVRRSFAPLMPHPKTTRQNE